MNFRFVNRFKIGKRKHFESEVVLDYVTHLLYCNITRTCFEII